MTTIVQREPTAAPARRVVYPTRDGKPMAETDKHRRLMMYVIDALTVYFADRSDVYVSGNNFVFWEEGNPRARISPDAYVVYGVSPEARDSYMAWNEGDRLPSVVFELTSRKTQREDTDTKLPFMSRRCERPNTFCSIQLATTCGPGCKAIVWRTDIMSVWNSSMTACTASS